MFCLRGLLLSLTCCRGWRSNGQLNVPSLNFTHVDAGESHACGVAADKTIRCWGLNTFGQAPATVTSSPAGGFRSVSCGAKATCALQLSGQLQCWVRSLLPYFPASSCLAC